MGIQQFDPTTYEMEYLPQRLQSLDACIMACHAVLNQQASKNKFELEFGEFTLNLPDLNLFVNLALDAGLVANRTLLNFMGIKLDNGGIINQSYGLNISEFGLPLVPVSTAIQVLTPSIPSSELQNCWIEALCTASKSIAHFTETGATIQVARLGYASHATSVLVKKYFYEAQSKESPASIVPHRIVPRLGTVWDAVCPWEQVRC